MNCEDVSRIADSGDFSQLGEVDRLAAHGHARSCQRCAAVWAAHVRLAELAIPPMPPGFALHLRANSGMPPKGRRQNAGRRLTVIGGLAAIAAAAGVLMWRSESAPPLPPSATVAAAISAAQQPLTQEVARPDARASEDAAATVASQPQAAALPSLVLPLIPRPRMQPPDGEAALAALEKIVQRHPELVDGPPLDDDVQFFVALAMRTDGTVISSAAELGTLATYTETSVKVARTLPSDTGIDLNMNYTKGQSLSAGRALRANTMMRTTTLPGSYDIARSEIRVREILGHQYDALMLPSTSEEANLLTIFLSEDGRITLEKVDRLDMQNAASVLGRGTMRNEDAIAIALGISVEQIGLMGMTQLEQGTRRIVVSEDGTSRMDGGLRVLGIRYAWARRPDETAAYRAPPPSSSSEEPPINEAAVRTVVEQLMPDAFSPVSLAAGRPTLVLTARGEVIRAGRVQMRNGESTTDQIIKQLVPGMQIRSSGTRSVSLADKTGATALVMLAWVD
jgi:hypothetical protein